MLKRRVPDMTQTVNNSAHREQRRLAWIARIEELIAEIASWSQAEGWQVERHEKTLREAAFGEYQAPCLQIHLPGGELSVNPIALQAVGADGRVDLEAFPTLSRVKLVGSPEGWKIITDSNVPIRSPWNRETFVQLAHDLLS
jgi:hypothetical protein